MIVTVALTVPLKLGVAESVADVLRVALTV